MSTRARVRATPSQLGTIDGWFTALGIYTEGERMAWARQVLGPCKNHPAQIRDLNRNQAGTLLLSLEESGRTGRQP